MKTLNFILGVLVLAASALVAPAALGSVVASAAGALLLGASMLQPAIAAPAMPSAPAAIVRAAPPRDLLQVIELRNGVVVFREVDGRLVSRFYRG